MSFKIHQFAFYLTFIAAFHMSLSFQTQPNFLFILTDDQDTALNGMFPLKKTQEIIKHDGAEFTNMFVTTPLCCPSRASILTGKYIHSHGVVNNSINGNCNSQQWQIQHEPKSFITHFKGAGYTTFYAGKYLNQYGNARSGGEKHIPPGWDHWIGLVGNSCYFNYTLSYNGKAVKHGSDPQKDYLTDVIFKEADTFISNHNSAKPFFMFLSPPSPHAPFTPAAGHTSEFSNYSAPRTPNFNFHSGNTKHWLLRTPPHPLPSNVIKTIDEVFRNRWRTLLSVDDGIEKIFLTLKRKQLLDNTYIIFTSDNGFHLGQFSLPWDKRQPYETDIRVPLLVRGPGITKELKIDQPVLNIDLAPTFLDLAGIKTSENFDGISFSTLLRNPLKSNWRENFFVEYRGESSDNSIPGCPQYKPHEVHNCRIDCICEDSRNNTYVCYRTLTKMENSLICMFEDDENFVEIYNMAEDPYQLKNLFPFIDPHVILTDFIDFQNTIIN